MVAFGTYLVQFRNPAWVNEYLSYEELKKALYALADCVKDMPAEKLASMHQSDLAEGREFERLLISDLDKIDAFYEEELAKLKKTFKELREQTSHLATLSASSAQLLKTSFHHFYVQLCLLRDFSSLNYTGISKLLKKHDKLLPFFRMKSLFFSSEVNRRPVFLVLDAVLHMQSESLHLYASSFAEFNRLDAEISFGESLARASHEMALQSGRMDERRRRDADKASGKARVRDAAMRAGDSETFFLTDPSFARMDKQKKENQKMTSAALWQRARLTMMAATAENNYLKSILVSLVMMMVGGIGQSFCLEYMVKIDPGCGSTITFFQFVIVTAEGLMNYLTWKPADGDATPSLFKRIRSIRLLPRKIPIHYHIGCVVLSWLSSVLSGVVYSYNVSVPFHMVFKSSILLVNMAIGYIVMKRRYEYGQVASVLILTIGVILTTLVSLPKASSSASLAEQQSSYASWLFGVTLLAVSLVFTGFLGILQDMAYRNHGKHWEEALFYAHFLGLPLFMTLAPEIVEHTTQWTIAHKIMWVFLALNTAASFLTVRGMYKLTGLTSSLTGNLMLTVRKFISLIVSVAYFKTNFTALHWGGALLVLLGTVTYTKYSQVTSPGKKDKKEK